MSYSKSIILRFGYLWKPAYALKLAVCMKKILPSSKNFMSIGLVTYIPNNFVFRSIKNFMKGNC